MLLAAPKGEPLAEQIMTQDFMALEPSIAAAEFYLTIQAPTGQAYEFVFDGSDVPLLHVSDLDDQVEGVYHFNLVARPLLSEDARKFLREHRSQTHAVTLNSLRQQGLLPQVSLSMNGSFRIEQGTFFTPSADTEERFDVTGKMDPAATQDKEEEEKEEEDISIVSDQDTSSRDQVYSDDLIVQGSQCVGTGCTPSESFGYDTLRFKENNLRIHFDDTSTATNFAKNDWRIVVNSSATGGDSFFQINDVTADEKPFKILAGAKTDSFFIDAQGDVGLGTNTPITKLHLKSGNTPTVRLEQDGTGSWAPQTWDIAGNEENFFIRDVTNSQQLPFRIRPGAAANSLVITNNKVGLYTNSPDSTLHLATDTGTTKFHIEDKNTTAADRDLFVISNKGGSRIVLNNTDNGETWKLTNARNANAFNITFGGTGQRELELSETGDLTIANNITAGGTVTGSSDRNIKENFKSINYEDILNKVSSLEITEWNYIADQDQTRHIGPMAQDFYAAFGVGIDDKHISMVDGHGIALASIRALNEKIEHKDATIKAITQQNQALSQKLDRLEALLDRMGE